VWEEHDSVPLLRFEGTETLNAFSLDTYEALAEALRHFSAQPRWKALILTGGGRAFCSGQDLGEVRDTMNLPNVAMQRHVDSLQSITRQMLDIPKLLIAAVNGPAVGFGAEVTLGCDVRFASPEGYFMFPELAAGLYFTNATLELLPALVGHAKACELLLGGRKWPASEAMAAGFVSQVAPGAELVAAARAFAVQAVGSPGPGSSLTLSFLRRRRRAAVEAALAFETETFLTNRIAGRSLP
jgi:2-(1,2-epoxy-1,2-dihydrophenyl)acetyl-CoA isomerase